MSRGAGRVYYRDQGSARRYYGDFRDYADVGGRQEALIPRGTKRATTNADEADVLAARRLKELQELRLRGLHGLPQPVGLGAYAQQHLDKKAQANVVTEQALAADQRHLERAALFFGADRALTAIDVAAVTAWIAALRDKGFGNDTIRHHLHSLSNTFRRAQAEGRVSLGYNPVSACEKPPGVHREARWLEVDEAALLLEAARTYRARCDWLAVPFAYELVATGLLTGGRPSEILGLEVDDVSLDRETVTFRPHAHRRLKTRTSHRTIPLWPQLAEILRAYFPRREQMGEGTLLFPSFRTGREAMLQHPHRIVAAVAERIGHAAGEVTPYTLRHTFTAARLQTLDGGAPVSPFTVGRELGHGGDALVRKVYGHLGTVRHRSAAVEYRVEQHVASLGDRLTALQASAV